MIATILYDVIEDTDVETKEVEAEFGKKIGKLVEANSFDESIEAKTTRYKENFERCRKTGKDALVVKAADFFDNSKDVLKDEDLYGELVKKYKRIAKTF